MVSKEDMERLDDQGMAAWNSHDPDAFVGLFADDFVWRDDTLPQPMREKAAAREYFAGWAIAFPDLESKETNRVVGEDSVAVEVEFTGTNTGPLRMGGQEIPPTGKSIVGHGTYFARSRDGRTISEFNSHPDVAGMMAQLGLAPEG